jgi:hypothetical protein
MSSSKPSFLPVTLGHGSNYVSIQLLKFLPTNAPLLDNIQAFAYFEKAIAQMPKEMVDGSINLASLRIVKCK